MVIRESRPKEISAADAKLCRLWTMTLTVCGTEMVWRTAQSRSLSDQPPHLEYLRCNIMASLEPAGERREGFPKRREEELLGELGQSHKKLP